MTNVVKRIVRRISSMRYGWFGNYNSWSDAQKDSTGYDSNLIVNKVKDALIKVRNGEAAFERDSVLFYEIEYSWPLLSSLLWIASLRKGKLRVIDFGGSLGTTYFQHKKILDTLEEIQWNVVEQKVFVETGKQTFEDDRLKFYETVEDCLKKGPVDVILFGCMLHYLESPYEVLGNIMKRNIPYIIVDNMPFIEGPDRITVQKVPPEIYPASYPCRLMNREKFLAFVEQSYERVTSNKSGYSIRLGLGKIEMEGYLFKLKTLS